MNRRSTNAILLRTRPLREADLLCTYLTADAGRLTGVAANARRSQRRFGGALEPGTIGALAFTEREGQELVAVDEMRVEWSPLPRMTALPIFAALGVILEIAEATTVERQTSPEEFTLLCTAICRVAEAPLVTMVQWCLQWLAITGFAPNFDQCARCGTGAVDRPLVVFSAAEGGAVCPSCAVSARGTMPFQPTEHAVWTQLMTRAWSDEAAMPLAPCRTLLCDGLWAYYCHVVGRPLKSRVYWELVWR